MSATATLVHQSSREASTRLAVARVAAAGRVRAERMRREAEREFARRNGQLLDEHGFGEWCLICSRATDHFGEHTDEQIAAWRAGAL